MINKSSVLDELKKRSWVKREQLELLDGRRDKSEKLARFLAEYA